MPDPAEPPVLHARLPHGQGGLGGPSLPGLHPAVQLDPSGGSYKVYYFIGI